jgi:hypothetical protein
MSTVNVGGGGGGDNYGMVLQYVILSYDMTGFESKLI